MILIADSGSTKTHWTITDGKGTVSESVFTDGLNPFYRTEDALYNVLRDELFHKLQEQNPTDIFFYGTGCSQKDKVQKMHCAIQRAFPNANVVVEHDLLGAAYATCGRHPGIGCIIGTGSNSCLFDGKAIIDNVTNLGFILGDEGSGGYFGRKILQAYFYREFPAELAEKMRISYNMDKDYILNRVYEGELPNQFVASFAKFISENNEHPFIKNMVYLGFREFLERHVMKYQGAQQLPVHFIGSIAQLNQSILFKAMDELGLQHGNILRSPTEGLVRYHTA
jgi:N-acetylglucosamine kinase-like BadF-type ATPase